MPATNVDGLDFARAGLLDGSESERERRARVALLRKLNAAGVPLHELKRALEEDRLAVLPIELMYRRESRYTLEEVLDACGLDEDFLRRDFLALGLPFPARSERAFTDRDLTSLRMVKRLIELGLPEDHLLGVARVVGRAAAQTAEAIMQTFLDTFTAPGDTDVAVGLRFAHIAEELAPMLGPLTEPVIQGHLYELVRREAFGRTERTAGQLPGAQQVTVAFVDLVDFTSFSERVPIQRLADVARRFEALASQTAEPPVRLVKLIGDAAMLVSTDTEALTEAARRLVETAAEDPHLPPVRAGLAHGPAVRHGGDWYGRAVNLASRVTGAAAPGTVLATASVAAATRADYRWESLAPRSFKGIDGKVDVYHLATRLSENE